VDIGIVLAEYEQYHEIKFGQLPTIIKKVADDGILGPDSKSRGLKRSNNGINKEGGHQKFPPVRQSSNKPDTNSQGDSKNHDSRVQGESRTPTTQASTKEFKAKGGLPPRSVEAHNPKGPLNLEIEGEQVDLTKKVLAANDKNKKPEMEDDEEYFQARVLKGIPEIYAGNNELRELALTLQR
jgi:hypothetical protein